MMSLFKSFSRHYFEPWYPGFRMWSYITSLAVKSWIISFDVCWKMAAWPLFYCVCFRTSCFVLPLTASSQETACSEVFSKMYVRLWFYSSIHVCNAGSVEMRMLELWKWAVSCHMVREDPGSARQACQISGIISLAGSKEFRNASRIQT